MGFITCIWKCKQSFCVHISGEQKTKFAQFWVIWVSWETWHTFLNKTSFGTKKKKGERRREGCWMKTLGKHSNFESVGFSHPKSSFLFFFFQECWGRGGRFFNGKRPFFCYMLSSNCRTSRPSAWRKSLTWRTVYSPRWN